MNQFFEGKDLPQPRPNRLYLGQFYSINSSSYKEYWVLITEQYMYDWSIYLNLFIWLCKIFNALGGHTQTMQSFFKEFNSPSP